MFGAHNTSEKKMEKKYTEMSYNSITQIHIGTDTDTDTGKESRKEEKHVCNARQCLSNDRSAFVCIKHKIEYSVSSSDIDNKTYKQYAVNVKQKETDRKNSHTRLIIWNLNQQ